MGKLTHFANKSIEYLFYTLFFFVPLILWPKTSEVFEFNKMLFVYGITILISTAWIIKWIDQKKITIRRTPLDLPIFLFLLSQILSTIFSIDLHTSLWGYYSRFHGGLISTMSYIVLYYALVSNFKDITFLIYSILSSAVLVSFYGVLEHFGIDKNLWVQDVQSRVFSTLGQPNWLSAYLVAILPLPIFYAVKSKNKTHLAVWVSMALLFLVTIWFTKSQSGIGATAITLAALATYFLGRKFKPTYFIALALVIVGFVFKWNYLQKISPFGPPNLAALVEQDNKTRTAGSDSMVIRQVVWQGAREIAKRNPLFGTGVETFGYSYFNVRPALHNLLSEWEFLYNKAHNEFLNILANTGFFGLSTYLLLIGVTLWYLSTKLKEMTIINGFVFGYLSILITNYFGFSVVPIALFFFLFPALFLVYTQKHETLLSLKLNLNPTLGIFIISAVSLYLLFIPIHQFQADIAYNKGKQYLALSYLKPGLENLERAKQLSPNEALFYSQLAEGQAMGAVSVKQQLDGAGASLSAELKTSGAKLENDLIASALQNSTKAIELNPNHTNFYKSKAKTELYLGTIDPKYNDEALKTLLSLEKLAPTDAKVLFNIGLLYESDNQKEKAREYYNKSIQMKPGYDGPINALKALKK